MLGTTDCARSVVEALVPYGPVVTAGAILISAGLAALLAIRTISSNREMARKAATLDLILKTESDQHFRELRAQFMSARDAGKLLELLDATTAQDKELRRDVQLFLNHYELIAVSIKKKILDEAFYKNWRFTTVTDHWKASKPMVEQIQKKAPTIYSEFQRLAEKWIKEGYTTKK